MSESRISGDGVSPHLDPKEQNDKLETEPQPDLAEEAQHISLPPRPEPQNDQSETKHQTDTAGADRHIPLPPSPDIQNDQPDPAGANIPTQPPAPLPPSPRYTPPPPPPVPFPSSPPIPYPNPNPEPLPGPEPDPNPDPCPYPDFDGLFQHRVHVKKGSLNKPRFRLGPGTDCSGFSISAQSPISFEAMSLISQLPSPVISTRVIDEARKIQLNLKYKDPEASAEKRARRESIDEESKPSGEGESLKGSPGNKKEKAEEDKGRRENDMESSTSERQVLDFNRERAEQPEKQPDGSVHDQGHEYTEGQEPGQDPIQEQEFGAGDALTEERRHGRSSHEGGSNPDAPTEVETFKQLEGSNGASQRAPQANGVAITADSSSGSASAQGPDPAEIARRKEIRDGKRPLREISEFNNELSSTLVSASRSQGQATRYSNSLLPRLINPTKPKRRNSPQQIIEKPPTVAPHLSRWAAARSRFYSSNFHRSYHDRSLLHKVHLRPQSGLYA